MLKDKNIICISTIDWDFLWQGHQEIMTRFARAGNKVLYIENTGVRTPGIRDISRIKSRLKNWKKGLGGIRQVDDNIFVYSPVVLPFPYSKVAMKINSWIMLKLIKSWMESISFHDPVIWTFLPTELSINLIKHIKNQLVIYYCIDSFVDSSPGAKKIIGSEEKMFALADLIFTTSHNLMDKARKFNENVYFFPFAVDLEGFTKDSIKCNNKVAKFKRPVVGYIGGIHKWIDFDLVKEIALKRQDLTFVFVGPKQVDVSSLEKLDNIHFLGSAKHNELPGYILSFDVCIIPYVIAKYTQNVYPTKLTEYLMMGKPVVSTAIVELEMFSKANPGIVELAYDVESFAEKIDVCIKCKNGDIVEKRVEQAKQNTWGIHVNSMSDLITSKIEEKQNTPSSWQENFKKFYYHKKSGLYKFAVCFCLFWILLFHTPLIWFFSTPLVKQDEILKSDAVIVLGGGVGESGKAGQGYIERTEKAIEIYKSGKTENVLFMSGYAYLMKEAEMMRAFGVEYGIPVDKIFIDTIASNTYLYAKQAVTMAKNKGWKRLVVISSPYNMFRARLCFDEILGVSDIEVKYVPVNNSSFYNWPRKYPVFSFNSQITYEQLRGLIHEVLAVLYYMHKGYI